MIYLAIHSGEKQDKTGIKKIAGELEIPAPFLAKILQLLAKHKLLTSSKGPNGGFLLARSASKITLNEIISVIDGGDIFDKCLISLRTCNEENTPCPLHDKYAPIREEIRKLFSEQDLGSLVSDITSQERIFSL
jgi:Rrf2 family protein